MPFDSELSNNKGFIIEGSLKRQNAPLDSVEDDFGLGQAQEVSPYRQEG